MRVDIHHHAPPVDTRVLDKLDLILAEQELLMNSLERIEAAAAAYDGIEDRIAAMITDLKHQLADALSGTKLPPDVEARLAAIFPHLEENNGKLTEILTAAQPAADPAPVPVESPVTSTALPDEPAPTGTTDQQASEA